jgi:aminoglycoside 2''-phosphotransferase
MYRHLSKDSIELEYKHLEEIAKAYPELTIDTVKYKDDGLVYDIISINNEWIFRFPKYDWAVEDMFNESACLNLAARYTNIPLPAWEMYKKSFIRYKKIAGAVMTPHEYNKLEPHQQEHIAGQLGLFLQNMHTVPRKEITLANIPESLTAHSYDEWLKLYDDVQQELFEFMTASGRAAVDTLFRTIIGDNTFTEHKPAFINGELIDYHIIFDPEEGKINGIIDFGSGGIGDPAADFASLLLQYGELFVSRMAAYYPRLDKLIDRARFIAATYPLQWALGGVRTGDYSWLMVHLGKTGNIFPIGTPLARTS